MNINSPAREGQVRAVRRSPVESLTQSDGSPDVNVRGRDAKDAKRPAFAEPRRQLDALARPSPPGSPFARCEEDMFAPWKYRPARGKRLVDGRRAGAPRRWSWPAG